MITLHQLRIFWAAAHSTSLTRAAKQLSLSQPSLSQQLAKLESIVGARLFDRSGLQLEITDAGRFLLRRAEAILAQVDEAEAGLAEFTAGRRGRIAVGTLNSLARSLVPAAYGRALAQMPELELDVHELSPAEAIEQLYGRNLHIAVLSASSIAESRVSFARIEIAADPYALAVPRGLDLSRVLDPEADLGADQRRLLNRCIEFNFGNAHTRRVEEWYRRVLPQHQVIAYCRTYEMALAMVEAGHGVALVPLLTAQLNGRLLFETQLYEVPLPKRPIVALVPSQYRTLQPYAGFLGGLAAAGAALELPRPAPPPPFLFRVAAAAE